MVLDHVDHDVVASVEFLPQPAAFASTAIGMVRFLPLAGLFFPAIPHNADVHIVGELIAQPVKCVGLRSVHNNEFHVYGRMVSGRPHGEPLEPSKTQAAHHAR